MCIKHSASSDSWLIDASRCSNKQVLIHWEEKKIRKNKQYLIQLRSKNNASKTHEKKISLFKNFPYFSLKDRLFFCCSFFKTEPHNTKLPLTVPVVKIFPVLSQFHRLQANAQKESINKSCFHSEVLKTLCSATLA